VLDGLAVAAGRTLTGHMAIRTLWAKRLLAVALTGAAMNQTQIGNRVVVIGPTASATEKIACRVPAPQRATPHRIVVIKNGELVGGRPGR
jgi:hypothetical protein